MAKRLPDHPDIAQYRRQAKDLLRALARGDTEASARMQLFHPRPDSSPAPRLADTQLVLAREHGFSSWPRFQAHLAALSGAEAGRTSARIACKGGSLGLELRRAQQGKGVVLFVLAGDVGRSHAGVLQIADGLGDAGFDVVLADLLTDSEAVEDAIHEELRFDLVLLKERVSLVADWIENHAALSGRPLGLYGSGTGGAAAILFAGERPASICAMVCAAGHPDLAGPWIWRVQAPTLFAVGAEDVVARGFTRSALTIFSKTVPSRFEVVDGASFRFEDGPAAAHVASLASSWFEDHLAGRAGAEEVRP